MSKIHAYWVNPVLPEGVSDEDGRGSTDAGGVF